MKIKNFSKWYFNK